MDVLIKGLALPKKGESCINLKIYSDGTVHEIGMYSGEIIPNKAKAIELPPHGELMDKKAFFESEKGRTVVIGRAGARAIRELYDRIEKAPAVVEATT